MIAKIISINRKAKHEYEILETYIAGIVLKGTEVKSARQYSVSIKEAHIGEMENSRELYLFNANFPEYPKANTEQHDPKRPRKLLLNKKELNKLIGQVKKKGLTIVPLQMYFNEKGLVKVEIALARGKSLIDKRETIKQREWDKEKHRVLKRNN